MNCKKLIALLCLFLFSSIVVNNDLAHASNKPISTVVAKDVNSEKYVSNVGDLILRDAAHSKGKKVTMLKKGSKVFVYSTDENGWSYVKQGKLKGYVKDSYLTTKNTSKKSNSAAKSNTTTKSSSTPKKAEGYGNIKGTVTWQYNDFIGTKPDVGAKVFLIPTDFNYKNYKGSLTSFAVGINDDKNKLFVGKVNGYGTYEISDIPVGEYLAIIVSKNTTRDFMEDVPYYTKDVIEDLLGAKGYESFEIMNLNLSKHDWSTIEIKKDKTFDYSIDFGNTFI